MALTALIRGETAWFAWHRTAKAQPGRELHRSATAKHSENSMGTFGAVYSKGYEVNCCAVALRSTDRQGKGEAEHGDAKEWQRKALM